MPSSADQLIEAWEGKGQEDTIVDVNRLAVSLRLVLEDLQKKNTSAASLLSIRESANALRKHIEYAQQSPRTYRQMLSVPNYSSDIHTLASKVSLVLNTQGIASPSQSPSVSSPTMPNRTSATNSAVPTPGSLRRSVTTTPTSPSPSLPSSFIKLSNPPALPPPLSQGPSNKKLSDYKMHVVINEEGNLFRCVDPETRRATCQRFEYNENSIGEMEKTLNFLSRSEHPYVMKVSYYWFESGYIYVHSPIYSHCTLKEWLAKNNPSKNEFQEMFSKVLCGLAFLHENGVVHGSLSADNIVVALEQHNNSDSCYPIICGIGNPPSIFDRENGQFRTYAGKLTDYLDVWLLGSAMYEHATGKTVKYTCGKNKKYVNYPDFNGLDENLVSVLKRMLHKDPPKRLSSSTLLTHPYFARSFFSVAGSSAELPGICKKISDLRFNPVTNTSPIFLEVQRGKVLETTLKFFSSFTASDLVREFKFCFSSGSSNPVVDNYEATQELWKSVIYQNTLFEAYLFDKMIYFLPAKDSNPDIYRSLGKLVLKFLFDRKKIPQPIAYLAANAIKWSKLGILDGQRTDSLTEAESAILSAYKPKIMALAQGIQLVDIFSSSVFDLMTFSNGSHEFTYHQIISKIQFYDFYTTSPTPEYIKDAIIGCSIRQLQRILLFSSLQCSLRHFTPASTDTGTLSFQEQELVLKFVRKKGTSAKGDIHRIGSGTIDIFEFDDQEQFTRAWNSVMSC